MAYMKYVRGSFLCTLVLSAIGVIGISASVALTRDMRWMRWHLSRLGEGGGFAAHIFNFTLIACAICLLCVAWQIYDELSYDAHDKNRPMIPLLLSATAICWMGVGLFPFDHYPVIHNVFGYSEFILLGALMLGAKRWHRIISERTYWLGYSAVFVSSAMMLGFHLTHFTSLLVVELVGEAFLFAWLVSFTFDSSRREPKTA